MCAVATIASLCLEYTLVESSSGRSLVGYNKDQPCSHTTPPEGRERYRSEQLLRGVEEWVSRSLTLSPILYFVASACSGIVATIITASSNTSLCTTSLTSTGSSSMVTIECGL